MSTDGESDNGIVMKPVKAKYELAMHSVKVRRSGTLSDVSALWDLQQGTAVMSASSMSCHYKQMEGDKNRFQRTTSVDSFNLRSHPNEMLTGLRYFERAIKGENNEHAKTAFSWGAVEKGALARCLLQYVVRPRMCWHLNRGFLG
uniref:Uncharacterized protein LOC102807058 n=1 Tax=Saccoglossus kowalevskii TaxID=10224 RepID=A0ABM0M695_SACKO|nr:PREDICTED: uncharacterized protein LOC102807058 [Saccoglossus kowalevskii]